MSAAANMSKALHVVRMSLRGGVPSHSAAGMPTGASLRCMLASTVVLHVQAADRSCALLPDLKQTYTLCLSLLAWHGEGCQGHALLDTSCQLSISIPCLWLVARLYMREYGSVLTGQIRRASQQLSPRLYPSGAWRSSRASNFLLHCCFHGPHSA